MAIEYDTEPMTLEKVDCNHFFHESGNEFRWWYIVKIPVRTCERLVDAIDHSVNGFPTDEPRSYEPDAIPDTVHEMLLAYVCEAEGLPTFEPIKDRLWLVKLQEEDSLTQNKLICYMEYQIETSVDGDLLPSREYMEALGLDNEVMLDEFQSRPEGAWASGVIEDCIQCPIRGCFDYFKDSEEMHEHCIEEHGWWDEEFAALFE